VLRGWEIVDNVARPCLMNLDLHVFGEQDSPNTVGDTIFQVYVDLVDPQLPDNSQILTSSDLKNSNSVWL
jgi:hypothetical protein